MCGIAGIFAYRHGASPVNPEELHRIQDAMRVRGPDGEGLWMASDGRIGLAHRRLSIIDLSDAGAQPMVSEDGNLRVVFNGEIYNYRVLQQELKHQGYRFRSNSDTEVLLHLYAAEGPGMVHRLRGMFAFALWDERKKGLLLARDPFGIKPLYYADDGHMLRVASQVKALRAGGGVHTSPEPAGHVGFLLWGYVPEPFTLFKSIRALPPGSTLWVNQEGAVRVDSFFNISDELAKASQMVVEFNPDETRERLRSALLDSVQHHLVSDVPVGMFLSAGIDSSTIAALAVEVGGNRLQGVTLGFKEYASTVNNETFLAEQIARHFGISHQTRWVVSADFQSELDRLLEAMDQPSIDGVNTYFVSKAAAEAGMKVALSGLGGDELFGGYPSFRDVPQITRLCGFTGNVPGLGRAFRVMSAPLLKRFTSPKYASMFELGGSYGGAYLLRRGLFMPWELTDMLAPEMVREGLQELDTVARLEETVKGLESNRLRLTALEMTWYMRNQLLRDTDWAGMAHSVEIRVPLVDVEFFRQIIPWLASTRAPSKVDLALIPKKRLPASIINRPKTGFNIPVRDWLTPASGSSTEQRGLRGWAKRIYSQANACKRILVLAPDAFGGVGGIAKFNRDLLAAVCAHPGVQEVVAIPRLIRSSSEPLPRKLTYVTEGAGGKIKYLSAVWKVVRSNSRFDAVICAHINLLPVAYVLRTILSAPLMLFIHGVDAWQPTKSRLVNFLVRRIDRCVAVSKVTTERFLSWSRLKGATASLLPCAINIERYGPGEKNTALVQRYGLAGQTVLMTLGRLAAEERYKGIEEVMELLPDLAQEFPEIVYLIVGDGNDRQRLQERAKFYGIERRVKFAGFIPESEKADHYRLADAYVMPGWGEGFGIVYLEAMACGIPVVASSVDGSREAVRDGELGVLVNPRDKEDMKRGIREALRRQKGVVPPGLEYFSFRNFERRCHAILDQMLAIANNVPRPALLSHVP